MRNSPLLPIALIVIVDVLGLTIILPLLPFYAEHFGAQPLTVGLLVTTYAACQLFSGPLLGSISDRVGRRPLLLVSQVGTFLGFLLLAFSTSLWMVFLSRFIDGVTAGNLSLAQAYISDVTSPENRARAFGIIGAAFGIGFLIGPAISGFLSQYGYQYPIFAAAGLSALSIGCTYFLLPRGPHVSAPPHQEKSTRQSPLQWRVYAPYFRRPGLSELLLEYFLFCFAFAIFTSGFAMFAERRFTTSTGAAFGPKEVGYVFAYAGFLGIILQGGFMGKLIKRWGERRLIVAGFSAALLGYLVLGLSANVATLLLSATLSSFGTGSLRPALTSLISQTAGRHEQGTVLGLTQSLNSIGQIVAPILAGYLIHEHLLTSWAWVAGAACATALGVALSQNIKRARNLNQMRRS